MVNSLGSSLRNWLPAEGNVPVISEIVPSHKRWIYHKENKAIEYTEWDGSDQEMSLEKICWRMNKVLKNYKKEVNIIKPEEHHELLELKNLVKNKTDEYKLRHSGFFGGIYLFFKGLGSKRYHIDVVSEKLLKNIDSLAKKKVAPDITDLDMFLNLAVPLAEDFDISLLQPVEEKLWVLDKEAGVIRDERVLDKKLFSTDLADILPVINQQLNAFQDLEFVTLLQNKKLAEFKQLIAFRGADKPELDAVIQEIHTKIDAIALKPIPKALTDEEKVKMNKTSNRVCEELFQTENTFLYKITLSILHLTELYKLSYNRDVKCSPLFEDFFRGDVKPTLEGEYKGNLEDCLNAFSDLKIKTEKFIFSLDQAINQSVSIETRNSALATLYKGPAYQEYAKATSVCARYYQLLCDFQRDLKTNNEKDGPVSTVFNDHLGHGIDPSSDFSSVFQRQPRHSLLTAELLKNTPAEEGPIYQNALETYIKALSYSVDVDRRLAFRFEP